MSGSLPAVPPAWAAPALASMLDRVAVTRAAVGDRFPLFADPYDGTWTTSGRGSWTGGFWAGLLWLRARRTGTPADREAARLCTARLAGWTGADTATRGLIFWYGTLHAADGDGGLRERAALACRDSFDAELGLVPWGAAFGGPRLLARVDAVPGLVPLLATVDAAAARSHLRRHLDLCLGRPPRHWAWRHDPARGWTAVKDPPPGWSRGPAWLLLAVAEAVRHVGFGELADVTTESMAGDLVPLADAARPDGPRDSSAAAVTATALLLLGHRSRAVAVLEELVRSHLSVDGRLLDGCYDLASATAVRHELIWGDFFLAYALALLTGLVAPA
ncbi:sugar ABC transporter permease [Streptomyces sp. NPDC089424]|uniref:sugar ABC transporter permease n=1 Tax=Streptomyces sp. NPDC089424 TaxID=3365917 RepID=UPI0038024E1D